MDWVDEEYRTVTRFELIDPHGRVYVRYGLEGAMTSLQDSGRTLKVFLRQDPTIFNTGDRVEATGSCLQRCFPRRGKHGPVYGTVAKKPQLGGNSLCVLVDGRNHPDYYARYFWKKLPDNK